MPDLAVVAATDLRRRIRSRSALVTAFVAPLALAVVFGLLFSGAGSDLKVGVADLSGEPAGAQIAAALTDEDDQGGLRFEPVDPRSDARRLVADGDLDSAVVIERGLTLTAVGAPDREIAAQVAESVAQQIAGRIDRAGAPGVDLHDLPLGGRALSSTAYFGAAMAILFLFFTVSFAAKSILDERRTRTLDRILAGPTSARSLVLGKVLSISVLAVAGFATVWLVTTAGFGATWGNPPAVLVLIVCTVFAMAGVATFVASLARTAQQSDTYAAVVTFVLALLGGNFTGPTDTPAALRALSKLTPNGWALTGFTDVSVDAASLGSITRSVVALVAFGVVFGVVGVTRVQRTMVA